MAFPVPEATATYRFAYRVTAALRPFLVRVEAHGQEHVPHTGGIVLAGNHTQGVEIFAMGLSCHRMVHFMAKAEIFEINPWLSRLLYAAGAFPVRRGQRDLSALDTAVDILRKGKALGIYPEGTRHPALARGKSGAVRMAMMANVPIVPVGVSGTLEAEERAFKFRRRGLVTVRFGPPIWFDGDAQDPVYVQRATTEMMVGIAQQLPPSMQGVYADAVRAEKRISTTSHRNRLPA